MPATRRRGSSPPDRYGKCRRCHDAELIWLRHERTGNLAPIDYWPMPGGNVAVDLEAGTYAVLAGEVRDLADPTTADIDAQPTLRFNHWVTCPAVLAEKARAARAAAAGAPDVDVADDVVEPLLADEMLADAAQHEADLLALLPDEDA